MNANDPQFLYMILILPTLFGLTLMGEGLNKVLKSETQGWLSIIFGLLFIGVVVFAFIFFSHYLPAK
jgi:threonine/homoserine/homoserine lactone efflux protein